MTFFQGSDVPFIYLCKYNTYLYMCIKFNSDRGKNYNPHNHYHNSRSKIFRCAACLTINLHKEQIK